MYAYQSVYLSVGETLTQRARGGRAVDAVFGLPRRLLPVTTVDVCTLPARNQPLAYTP